MRGAQLQGAAGRLQTLEVPVEGMDCADCTRHVRQAISALPGVESVEVYLASEKAVVRLNPALAGLRDVREAVGRAGYKVPQTTMAATAGEVGRHATEVEAGRFARQVLGIFGVLFGAVLFVVVAGEWLGITERFTGHVPLPIGAALVALAGYPVFLNVVKATLRGQVISHTLMTLGVLAALAVGQWATALVVVFFMRVGEYVENRTTEQARRAVKDLTALAPRTARVERSCEEVVVPVEQVGVGEIVVVRPGETIPVDGDVRSGSATVDNASITGESMPVEVSAGSHVYASTIARFGSLRVRAERVGPETTFGRIVKLVEEAEANRAGVQRLADRFSAYYLPVVAGIALLTLLIRRDAVATAAVLVVACSCSFAIATPVAMLASIGAAARRGLLIKGGKYVEVLARADVLLVDKTGTLTMGLPRISDVVALDGLGEDDLLALAASAEMYSEHPLAEAVRTAARERGLPTQRPEGFRALPGAGVEARVDGRVVTVGSAALVANAAGAESATVLGGQGKTLLYVGVSGEPAGILATGDTLRPEVPAALSSLTALGIKQIELLTGDSEDAAAALAGALGIRYRARLLPEDKIGIVREYQRQGHTVVMVGDGVNDAPALAQADVGIAMGASGTDIAVEAGHVILLSEQWSRIPELFEISRRTMRVVKGNIAFTALYNVVGLTLAALGILPPVFAAAAQSLPDLGILTNSSRLLRQNRKADAHDR